MGQRGTANKPDARLVRFRAIALLRSSSRNAREVRGFSEAIITGKKREVRGSHPGPRPPRPFPRCPVISFEGGGIGEADALAEMGAAVERPDQRHTLGTSVPRSTDITGSCNRAADSQSGAATSTAPHVRDGFRSGAVRRDVRLWGSIPRQQQRVLLTCLHPSS